MTQAGDRLCGCGYRDSLHRAKPDVSVYCQLAELRARSMTQTEAIQQVKAKADLLCARLEHMGCQWPELKELESALSSLVSAIEGARTTDEHEKELDTRVDEPAAGAPPTGSTAPSNEVVPIPDEIELRYCICADPEHCAEPVPGYVCKRGLIL